MLRMEIALILVLGFVAYIYYSAERAQTALPPHIFGAAGGGAGASGV